MFKENKTLIHLDLSHNNLKRIDCQIIDEGLKQNHTLLGIHMIGNEVNTDSLGFFKDSEHDPSISHIISRIKPTLNTGTVSKSKVELKATSNCWICEGWSQVLFKWNPYNHIGEDGKSIADLMDDTTVVYIHLSSDDYEADLMEKDETTGEFTLLRMVPPGTTKYYFSIAQPPMANQA
jgi:hypothetical protein